MKTRFDYSSAAPGTFKAMGALEQYLASTELDPRLLDLVKLRASQINGCVYCIDMHWNDLIAQGESDQRLYELNAWSECPIYSEREQAALEWTEAVTLISESHVPDSAYERVREHFTDKELCDLTLAIATINAWNRLSISARLVPELRVKAAVGV